MPATVSLLTPTEETDKYCKVPVVDSRTVLPTTIVPVSTVLPYKLHHAYSIYDYDLRKAVRCHVHVLFSLYTARNVP